MQSREERSTNSEKTLWNRIQRLSHEFADMDSDLSHSVVAELGFLILLVLFFFFMSQFLFALLLVLEISVVSCSSFQVWECIVYMHDLEPCATLQGCCSGREGPDSHRSQRANSCMASSRVRRRRGVVVWRRCFADEVGSNTGQCVAAQRSAS
ncbi:hypothetical protein GmHk_19G054083 [Glycine max]|nr:hypothetical protein GmHk_19G054083 [Glycine max]